VGREGGAGCGGRSCGGERKAARSERGHGGQGKRD
jgi:hypothetical protein